MKVTPQLICCLFIIASTFAQEQNFAPVDQELLARRFMSRFLAMRPIQDFAEEKEQWQDTLALTELQRWYPDPFEGAVIDDKFWRIAESQDPIYDRPIPKVPSR